MVFIRQNLIDSSKYALKSPYPMAPEFITVHNTYNDVSAANEISYMKSNSSSTSFHFAVDDQEVVQGIPINRNAWHAGDGAYGNGNRKSIAIEICYSKSGGERWEKAKQNAIQFIAQLLKERNWGVDQLKQHYDWSRKDCPHRLIAESWQGFVASIQAELDKLNTPVLAPISAPEPVPTQIGYLGDSIVDYLNSIGVDSSYSNRTRLAIQYGIQDYRGTAEQNLYLLNMIRSGVQQAISNVYAGDSIVDYLNSIGVASSFSNRATLATQYGINNYKGTAEQNLSLLRKIRGF